MPFPSRVRERRRKEKKVPFHVVSIINCRESRTSAELPECSRQRGRRRERTSTQPFPRASRGETRRLSLPRQQAGTRGPSAERGSEPPALFGAGERGCPRSCDPGSQKRPIVRATPHAPRPSAPPRTALRGGLLSPRRGSSPPRPPRRAPSPPRSGQRRPKSFAGRAGGPARPSPAGKKQRVG